MADQKYKGTLTLNVADENQAIWFGCTDQQTRTLGRLAAAPTSPDQCFYNKAFEPHDRHLGLWLRTKKLDAVSATNAANVLFFWPGFDKRAMEDFGNQTQNTSYMAIWYRTSGVAGVQGPYAPPGGVIFSTSGGAYDWTDTFVFAPKWGGSGAMFPTSVLPFSFMACAFRLNWSVIAADNTRFEVEALFSSR